MTSSTQIANRDYVLIIDKSGSMSEPLGTQTRFRAAEEATVALARYTEKLDPDGLDLYFFSSVFNRYEGVKADEIKTRYAENEPMGGTNLAEVLQDAFKHWEAKGKKDTTILVITDGAPTDPGAVANAIIAVSKKMNNEEQLAIEFLQVGDDPRATGYLSELDDGLTKLGAKFDIVDAQKWSDIEKSGKSFGDVLVAAIAHHH